MNIMQINILHKLLTLLSKNDRLGFLFLSLELKCKSSHEIDV